MTSEHNGRDRRLEDELYVDALLAESGIPAGSADDDGLRDTLLRLRSLRGAEVPQPCAELAALMGGAGPGLAEVIPLEGRARRHPKRRRAVFTSLAVAASLGIAGGAAAGNETVRRHAEGTIDTIVRSFSPPAPAPDPAAPAPAPPAEAPNPAPDVVPSPPWAVPPAASTPAAEAPVVEAPGHAANGVRKETPVKTERTPSKAAPPSSPAEQADGSRKSTGGTAPGFQERPGTPPTVAERPKAPGPKLSHGTPPR